MSENEIGQIIAAIGGLHGDISTLNASLGELKGKLENGISREVKEIKKWISTHPFECPLTRRDKLSWQIIRLLMNVSGWITAIIIALTYFAERSG